MEFIGISITRQPIVTLPERYMLYDSGQRVSADVKLHFHTRPQSDAAAQWMAAPALGSGLDGPGVAPGRRVALVCYRLDSAAFWRTGPVPGGRRSDAFRSAFNRNLPAT